MSNFPPLQCGHSGSRQNSIDKLPDSLDIVVSKVSRFLKFARVVNICECCSEDERSQTKRRVISRGISRGGGYTESGLSTARSNDLPLIAGGG